MGNDRCRLHPTPCLFKPAYESHRLSVRRFSGIFLSCEARSGTQIQGSSGKNLITVSPAILRPLHLGVLRPETSANLITVRIFATKARSLFLSPQGMNDRSLISTRSGAFLK
ncbi:hypothetical protein DPSP01_009798 [Paraphaeosphaeria sporulosa]